MLTEKEALNLKKGDILETEVASKPGYSSRLDTWIKVRIEGVRYNRNNLLCVEYQEVEKSTRRPVGKNFSACYTLFRR